MEKINKIALLFEVLDEGLLDKDEFISKLRNIMAEGITFETSEKVDKKRFTLTDLAYIKENVDIKSVSQIAKDLDRSPGAVAYHLNKIKHLKPEPKTRRTFKWNAESREFVTKELAKGTTQREIAEQLNIPVTSLKYRIRQIRYG